jgi:hypothetical protein
MLTGVSTRQEAEALPVDERPLALAADAEELEQVLARLAASAARDVNQEAARAGSEDVGEDVDREVADRDVGERLA